MQVSAKNCTYTKLQKILNYTTVLGQVVYVKDKSMMVRTVAQFHVAIVGGAYMRNDNLASFCQNC